MKDDEQPIAGRAADLAAHRVQDERPVVRQDLDAPRLLDGPYGNRDFGRLRRQWRVTRGMSQLELALNHPHEVLAFGQLAAHERLLAEYATLGFSASGHPLSLVRNALPNNLTLNRDLDSLKAGVKCQVAGLVVARQRPQTAKGTVFLLVEDETGLTNVIVRTDVYDRYRAAIRGEPFVLVTGKLAKDDGTVNVLAEKVEGLQMQRRRPSSPNLDSLHQPPMQFLRAMRRVAPDSKDWG